MALKIGLTNPQKFEKRLLGVHKALDEQASIVLKQFLQSESRDLVKSIENSSAFRSLYTSDKLRAKLGLAQASKKSGGDTGPEDLIKLLNTFTVTRRRAGGRYNIRVRFPGIQELESKLVHTLSKIKNGVVQPGGQIQSWFSWWEFGYFSIDSMTVMANKFKGKFAKLVENSRSGLGLQIVGKGMDGLDSTYTVSNAYDRFERSAVANATRFLNQKRAFLVRMMKNALSS